MATRRGSDTARQTGRFGLVGIANTALDFTIFSALRLVGLPLLVANFVSTSICMGFSFIANRRFVFSADGSSSWKKQALLFFPGTAFGMYVLQTLTILFLTRVFPEPLELAAIVAGWAGVHSATALLLVRSNAAKLAATAVSLVWNYSFYRFAVFAQRPAMTPSESVNIQDAR